MVAHHVATNADMTIGCIEVSLEAAQGFGVMAVDEQGRVVEFEEKPTHPKSIPNKPDQALASMGIYVITANFLYDELIKDADKSQSSHDFGKDIIPSIIDSKRVFTYAFRDVQQGKQAYWRDVGTVDAFWEANMELVSITPPLNFYDKQWPIWTYQEQLPPAKFVFDDDDRRGMAVDSMVSGGCIISGAKIVNSLLFSNVHLHSYSLLEQTVVLPDVDVGEHCHIKKAVIDKGCIIPAHTQIGVDPAEDEKRGFYVSESGVVLVTPEMLGQDLHYAR